MPRVKVDYVVSFSSETPDAPASNLLATDAGCGRWLCSRGEPSCSVLLQLSKAVQISSITIGAHLSALVEVLVGRSETPNDQFKVLIASSVFLSPPESRKAAEGDSAADRVRSFGRDQLAADVRDKLWDRVRVVCSQPYNKHCKYGLSFIHIFSPENETGDANTSNPALTPSRVPTKAALKLPFSLDPQDSDDDDLKPGALFAQHLAKKQAQEASNTGAQIRQATSQVLKNQSDSSAKIVRTPITKPRRDSGPTDQSRSDRTRDSLMYADEDDKPHDNIDRLVAAHKDQQSKNAENAAKEDKHHKDKTKHKDKHESDTSKNRSDDKDRSIRTTKEKHKDDSHRNRDDSCKTRDDSHRSKDDSHRNKDDSHRNKDDSHRSKDDSHRRRDDSHRSKNDVQKNRDIADRSKGDSLRKDEIENRNKTPQSSKRERGNSSKHDKDEDRSNKKQKVNQDTDKTLFAGPVSDEPHTLLSDVEFVLSGYENPRRAKVRDAALAMGATFHRDWGPRCTHLICAFPNTPKLKSVRSSPDGHKAIVVTAEWIERCAERQRRLPWQWFATETKYKVQRARSASGEDPPGAKNDDLSAEKLMEEPGTSKDFKELKENPKAEVDSDCDTDDEIEKVMQANAKKRLRTTSSDNEESPSKKSKCSKDEALNVSSESDVAFIKDERMQGNVTVSDSDSEATDQNEDTIEETYDIESIPSLPAFFEGCTFALQARSAQLDETLVRRYVRAYGGDIVEPQEDEDLEVDYILCLGGDSPESKVKGRAVRGDWVWACHERQRLCSPADFALV